MSDDAPTPPSPAGVFDVRTHGAAGDGRTDDTAAINRAVAACAAAGGGQVRLAPGAYRSGTVALADGVVLYLDAGARLIGTDDLDAYRAYSAPAGTPEAGGSKWHRALVLADGVRDAGVAGPGVIDGAKVPDPTGEEGMRGPHTILVGGSRGVSLRDVTVTDSANYAVMVEFSDDVDCRNLTVTGGWDGVHFRGWIDRPCRNLHITGCRFFTGDDSIAGRYAEGLLISGCVINSSCNGIRIIGPVAGMIVHDCLLYGPGLHPHRTQGRHNMLGGILLQPGAWDACDGPLRDVLLSGLTMRNVQAPVTLYLRRAGNSAADITVERLSATGAYHAAMSFESWLDDQPVGRVALRDVRVEYASAGRDADAIPATAEPPDKGVRPLPAWGLYARHCRELVAEDVRLTRAADEPADPRPAVLAENVETFTAANLHPPAT